MVGILGAVVLHVLVIGLLLLWWVMRSPGEEAGEGKAPMAAVLASEKSGEGEAVANPGGAGRPSPGEVDPAKVVPPPVGVGDQSSPGVELRLEPPTAPAVLDVGELPAGGDAFSEEKPAEGKEEEGLRLVRIGGLQIETERLGVVLDVSKSMGPHLPVVRKEIAEAFPDAPIREVIGCFLDGREGYQVVDAVEKLVVEDKVDAIYLFSDLADATTPGGLSGLQWQLLSAPQSGYDRTALYVRTVGEEPGKGLRDLIRVSGGDWEKR